MKIEAIEKREDVSPKEGKSKYGDVSFADEKNKKYPLDSETHVRAAWSYINMPKNASKYSAEDVKTIKGKIKRAGKKYGIEFSDDEEKKTESALVTAQTDMDGALDNLDTEEGTKAAWEHFKAHGNKLSDENRLNARARIKRAARKHGIDLADKEEEGETPEEESAEEAKASLVSCDLGIDLEGETSPEIVYMPGPGRQRIHASVNGKPRTVTVVVDAEGAERLAHDLEKRLSDEIRPHAGFDHAAGPASFLPQEFKWDESRGVVLKVDWTDAGKNAVSGRNYSYFSPTFLLGDEGQILGLPKTGEIGSMTNNPAFRRHEMKIAASADSEAHEEALIMGVVEKLVELKVITATQAEKADEDLVCAAIEQLHESVEALSTANKQLESANTSLRAQAAEVQKSEALSIVQAAIDEGKIPGKDQELIDHWTEQAIASPERTRRMLTALPANPLLQRVIDVKVKDGKRVQAGQSNADLVQAQHNVIAEVKAANPQMKFEDVFNKAKRDHPEVFPAEV